MSREKYHGDLPGKKPPTMKKKTVHTKPGGEWKPMRLNSFLSRQMGVLVLALISTGGCIYWAMSMLRTGIEGIYPFNFGAIGESYLGRNEGMAVAFGMLFPLLTAVLCWWSIISDWRESKRSSGRAKGDKPLEPSPDAKAGR